MPTGKFSASTFPLSSSESIGASGFGSPAGGSSVYALRGGQNARCTAGLSSNNDRNTTTPSTMDDRSRPSSRLHPCRYHRSTASSWCFRAAHPGPFGFRTSYVTLRASRNVSRLGFVRMRHVVRILGEPVRPGLLDAVLTEVDLADDEDVRRLGEVGLQAADVPIDLLVVQDVAVDLGERGVAVADASQQNDELQQVGVRLLPERLLRSAEQVVQQRGHGIGDGVRIQLVVQRVVADAGIEPDLDVVRVTACPVEHRSHLATEVALHFQDQATELARRIVRPSSGAVGRRTDTCRRTSCRFRPRPGS